MTIGDIGSIVLGKNENGEWLATIDDKATFLTGHRRDTKAGDVARDVALKNPEARIGVEAKVFGPATLVSFGKIVWMKQGFQNK